MKIHFSLEVPASLPIPIISQYPLGPTLNLPDPKGGVIPLTAGGGGMGMAVAMEAAQHIQSVQRGTAELRNERDERKREQDAKEIL